MQQETISSDQFIRHLGQRGEKILAENIHPDEHIKVKIKGAFGEGLVLTDKHIYVVKWGIMTGNTFGGKCTVFDYRNVTGLEIRKSLGSGVLEILSPATRDAYVSYWSQNRKQSAAKSNYAVTFYRRDFPFFQKAVQVGRDFISSTK